MKEEQTQNQEERMEYQKDTILTEIFTDESCREYLEAFIALCLKIDPQKIRNKLQVINSNYSSNESDIAKALNNMDPSDVLIKINYDPSKKSMLNYPKCIAIIILKQKSKEVIDEEAHSAYQINLNEFDTLDHNNFVYHFSYMDSETYEPRPGSIKIIEIDLDSLSRNDYKTFKEKKEKELMQLLYIFVCKDKKLSQELYQENPLTKEVYKKLNNLSES